MSPLDIMLHNSIAKTKKTSLQATKCQIKTKVSGEDAFSSQI